MKSMKMINPSSISGNSASAAKGNSVQLLVSNLEPSVGLSEWRRILFAHFQAVIPNVYQIIVHRQAEGGCYSIVKLANIRDAQLAIMQLNRRKIGYRRIRVSMLNTNCCPSSSQNVPDKQKKNISKLLLSAPGHVLPAGTFMQQFEKRFHCSISISELHRMRDLVEVRPSIGRRNDRLIALTGSTDQSQSSETIPQIEDPLCLRHRPSDPRECLQMLSQLCLPRVNISLTELRPNVVKVLRDHDNQIPLISFTRCYEALCGPLIKDDDERKTQFSLTSDTSTEQDTEATPLGLCALRAKGHVSLEHLLTCVPNVLIKTAADGTRVIMLQEPSQPVSPRKQESNTGTTASPPETRVAFEELQANKTLTASQENIRQLRREVVELIKMQPDCELFLSKFIPTYHSQFGKQCRVADYGFSRLQDVIDGLKGVIHVVGVGLARTVMLTHNIQIRRFTHELLRLLKSELRKSCPISQLPAMFEQVFHKEFVSSNYGVCSIMDLLTDISENTITLTNTPEGPIIVIPKRLQSPEQQRRTQMFAIEVVNMLSSMQRFQIAFTKFIPAYHHAFNRQCRVSEYGFVKLIELLESLPTVVEVIDEGSEKVIVLTNYIKMGIIKEILLTILEVQPSKQLLITEIAPNFLTHYRMVLVPEDYGFASLNDLLSSIPEVFLVNVLPDSSTLLPTSGFSLTGDGPIGSRRSDKSDDNLKPDASICVCLVNRGRVKQAAYRCLQLLFSSTFGFITESDFRERYFASFEEEVDFELIRREMSSFIQVSEYSDPPSTPIAASEGSTLQPSHHLPRYLQGREGGGGGGGGVLMVGVCPLILFARQLRSLLLRTRGRLMLAILEAMYRRHFGIALSPEAFGYPSLLTLVGAVSFVAVLRGRGARATLFLSQDYLGKLAWMISYNVVFRHQLLPDHNSEGSVLQSNFVENPIPTIPHQYDYYSTVQQLPPITGIPGHNWSFVQENQVITYPLNTTSTLMPLEGVDYSTQDPHGMQNGTTPFYVQNPFGYSSTATPNPGLLIGLGPPTPELSFSQPNCFDYTTLQQTIGDLLPCSPLMNKCNATPMISYCPQQFTSPSLCLRDGEQTTYAIPAGAWPAFDQTGQYIQFNAKPQMPMPCNYITPYCFKPLSMMPDGLTSSQPIHVSNGYPLDDPNQYMLQQGQSNLLAGCEDMVFEAEDSFKSYLPMTSAQHWPPTLPPDCLDQQTWNANSMIMPSWSNDQANELWKEWQNPAKPPSLQGWPPVTTSGEETREDTELEFSQKLRRENTGGDFVNKCEEGDWTLPLSMTTESTESNSKEMEETGSLESIIQTHV